MRGLVFTEFLEFVEKTAGAEMVETMLDSVTLDSDGAYTAVGTYDHNELLVMLTFLNQATGQDVSAMVRAFGQHLFGQLAQSHPAIVEGPGTILDFLEGIEDHIHKEVRKLYPDAELPKFSTSRPSDNVLVMDYHSSRPFADLAEGMICGASDFFDHAIQVDREPSADDGVRFTVKAA